MTHRERDELDSAAATKGVADDAEDESVAEPDVRSDRRVPRDPAEPGDAPVKPRNPPLAIKEIENLEDDAPGG